MLHKVQQNLQRLVKVVAALEQIAGLVKGSIRIGRRTGGRKALKSVQLLGLKQLVLKKCAIPSGTWVYSAASERLKRLSMEPYLVPITA